MTNKKQLENNLNKYFGCKDIHVHEVRDIDDNEQQGGHWESPSIKRASKAYGWDD